ncbi:MAG TPA: bacteriohopanetetrol glucosamine biosynthesis glycosyltransferase HpnI [Pseudolabrys sp.]|nr:bacteriohopanetetrol glucosamine biosynthesis glycosyltransferase HpnI [Pseudolabrys sp.]
MLMTADVLRWSVDTLMAGAVLGCGYLLIAGFLSARFRSAADTPEADPVPVTILVPLCGHEPGLMARLSALCEQRYAAPMQIVCGVSSPEDPAIAAVERVIAAHPDSAIDLHVDPMVHGRNLKISNLINMAERARHETLVLIDSDIEVGPDYLAAVIGELQRPGIGAVTCLYHGVAAGGLWAQLAAMGINTHFLPNVIVALATGLGEPCFGATIALSHDTLRRIGGFRAFADHLWDDYAIGQAVRELGLEVAVPGFALGHVCSDTSARQFLAAQLRYARTIKSIDPAGYAGGVISHPFPLALCAVLIGGGGHAIVLAAIALTCRIALCWQVERQFATRAGDYWLIPLRDLLSFTVYVASFFGATVKWRGQRFRLVDDTLVADPH